MVYITHLKDVRKLNNYASYQWAHVACRDDFDVMEDVLSMEKKISTAEMIEHITDAVRVNFVNFVGQLANQQDNRILWYSSRIASKSVSQTDIFHHYIYIKLVEKFTQSPEDVLIITDNDELISNISQLDMNNVQLLSHPVDKTRSFSNYLRGYRKILKYIGLWLYLILFKDKKVKDYNCFLHMWVDDRLYKFPSDTADPYWGDLENKLTENGFKVARLGPVSISLRDIHKVRRHVPNVILPLSYLGVSALLKCLRVTFNIMLDEQLFHDIEDKDFLIYLTKKEIVKEKLSKSYFDYLLYYFSYKGVGAYIFDTATVIYLYENQPWEKMLNLAFNGCNRIGYQHSTIPYNWLDYYCSEVELSEPRPTVVLTSGKRWTEFLEKSNKHIKLHEAGTIRYKYLFEDAPTGAAVKDTGKIVVALPIDSISAVQLQTQIFKMLDKQVLPDYQIIFKPHPHLPKRFLRSGLFKTYKNVMITDQPIAELMQDCELLVTINSTVAFEALFAGVKTMQFIPEELTNGIEHFISDVSFCAYEHNFQEKILEAVMSSTYPNVDVNEYFSPIDYQVFYDYAKVNLN